MLRRLCAALAPVRLAVLVPRRPSRWASAGRGRGEVGGRSSNAPGPFLAFSFFLSFFLFGEFWGSHCKMANFVFLVGAIQQLVPFDHFFLEFWVPTLK